MFSSCEKTSGETGNTLTVCTNATYPPYESIDKNGILIGFDIDLANELSKKFKKNLYLKNMDFDSLILGLNQNKCDLIIAGLSITSKRKQEIEMVQYQGELVKNYYLLFWEKIPSGIKKVEDIKNIGNKTVAVQVGTWMEEYLNTISAISGITIKPLESVSELLLEIKHNKSTAAFVEQNIIADLLNKEKSLQYIEVLLPKENWSKGNGIGIKKTNKILSKQVEDAIKDFEKSGFIKRLEMKWMKGLNNNL